MLKPVCVPCNRFFKPAPTGNGTPVLEQMPVGRAEPGNSEPERWRPYKLWVGDKMMCHGCGAEIVVGFAARPIAEHYMEGFAAEREKREDRLVTVNDC